MTIGNVDDQRLRQGGGGGAQQRQRRWLILGHHRPEMPAAIPVAS